VEHGFNVVGYDIERSWLPAGELENISSLISQASDLIHAEGLEMMVGSSRPTLKQFWNTADWTGVDIFLMPLQKVAGTPDYQILGERYAGHVRAMSPNTTIYANVNLEYATQETIVSEIQQLREKGLIDGVSILCMSCSAQEYSNLMTALGR